MPNRIIKESICTSDSIASLSDFQEAFFYRLIVNCDDYGRMDGRPAILKARLYPLRERLTLRDIESALRALAAVGCVEVYEVDGKPYLQLPSWEVHQQIRAKKSKFPAPVSNCNQMISDDIKYSRNPIQSESNPESESEREPTRKRGEYGWVKLTDEQYSKLVTDFGEAEVQRAIAYVDESAQSNGNKNKWKDWNLVIRKCIRDGWGLRGTGKQQKPIPAPQRAPGGEKERLQKLYDTFKKGGDDE